MLPNADSGRLVVGEYLPPWLGKGSIKKNLEFSRFGLKPPTHPCNQRKSGKKIKFLLF